MVYVYKVEEESKNLISTINKNKLDVKLIDKFCAENDLKYVIGYDWLRTEKHCILSHNDSENYYIFQLVEE